MNEKLNLSVSLKHVLQSGKDNLNLLASYVIMKLLLATVTRSALKKASDSFISNRYPLMQKKKKKKKGTINWKLWF